MYDDVRAHIQEMLDIGAIHKLHSPSRLVTGSPGPEERWQPEVLY